MIIATRIYDTWGRVEYLVALGGLMSPLLLQVFLFFLVLGGLMSPLLLPVLNSALIEP